MLENVQKLVSRKVRKTFDERFVDYVISVQDKNIELEMEYIRRHNKLDVLKLDRLINLTLDEVML